MRSASCATPQHTPQVGPFNSLNTDTLWDGGEGSASSSLSECHGTAAGDYRLCVYVPMRVISP
jgi:hypothetical protein